MNKNEFLEQVFKYVDENIIGHLSVNEISKKVNYSLYHFSRMFSELTGMSPIRYITLRKLQYAIFDLSINDKVLDTALKYNFDTPEGFSKAFKNFYGYSPTKYPFYDKVKQPQKMDMSIFTQIFGGKIMTSQPIQKGALKTLLTVEEKGVRKKSKNKMPTHAMGFPAMMSALKTFLGLSPRMKIHNYESDKQILFDLDYYFQIAVSTEGFGLFYDLPQGAIANNYWNGEPIKDCFNAEGIKYRLFAEEKCISKDELLIAENIETLIYEHLKKNLPLIIFYNANLYLFVTGICESNMQLLAFPFSDGNNINKAFELQKNSRLYQNWNDNIGAIIFIDGICEPAPRKDIVIKTLSRGYEMLVETKPTYYDYGFGDNLYKNWISYIDNDENYKTKKDSERYVSPEKHTLRMKT